jgi:TRAP-type C4-dicarboxylate transport system substrate-binding protein
MKQPTPWIVMLFLFIIIPKAACALDLLMGVPIPENTREYQTLTEAAKRIPDATDDTIHLVFSSPDRGKPGLAKKVMDKTLHGGLALGNDFKDLKLGPNAFIYALPFTFVSSRQVNRVRQGLDDDILSDLSKGPYEALGIVDFGFIYMMSSKPLSTPGDWLSRKIWIPEKGSFITGLESLGLKTFPIASNEVLTQLNNGTVDALIAPLSGAILKRWHTRIRTVFDSPFAYTYGIWILSDDVFDKLSDNEQKALKEQIPALCSGLSAVFWERSQKARQVLTRYRITFVEPIPDMQNQWARWADEFRENLGDNDKPAGAINDKFQKLLKHSL